MLRSTNIRGVSAYDQLFINRETQDDSCILARLQLTHAVTCRYDWSK